jgi:hypothetical protein
MKERRYARGQGFRIHVASYPVLGTCDHLGSSDDRSLSEAARRKKLKNGVLVGAGALPIEICRYPPAASQIAIAKTSVNAADIEGPIDKNLGTKEALAVRLRKFAINGEKTLQGVVELA